MTSIESPIGDYVSFKQALGLDFAGEAQRLNAYLEYSDGAPLTVELALEWACSGPGHPRSYQAQRYETVRRFSSFAHSLDRAAIALPPGILGKTDDRVVPYIYPDEDVAILMSCARSLKSPDGLRGEGLAFLLGLMRSCGLRIGEALGVCDADFHESELGLDVRESKFGTSRTIAVQPDVMQHVRGYQELRDSALRGRAPGKTIVSAGGKPLTGDSAEGMFSEIRWALLPRGASFEGRMPRLHDARHTFATATILRWHDEGVDVNAMIPYLSAYLSHKKLSDAYWYLTGVPQLLDAAAESFRSMGFGGDGDD